MTESNNRIDVIYSYTRRQAIADGVLIDVSETAKKCGIRCPVAVTSRVWARCVEAPPDVNTEDDARSLWHVLWMFRCAIRPTSDASRVSFLVSVRNDNMDSKEVYLWAACGPGDDGEPVITIMLPDEY